MVSLLTRKVRLPIPSLSQLDQARVFASSYEKQNVGDIFRVPFMRHQQHGPDLPPASDEEDEEDELMKAHKQGEEFGSTARDTVPSWIRDETVVDKIGGQPSSSSGQEKDHHETPEHFKLMAKAMEDWWMYDVYARIAMLYGVCCFLYAVSYYAIGTTISELRGFWISWSLPMLFQVAQALILRLDILQNNGQKFLPNVEFLGHIAPYFAIVATTLEFKFWYSPTSVDLTWVFVGLAFFSHMMMALRFLDLAWPDTEREVDMPEQATRQWWPASWKVPSAFTKALWVLAPPKKLEPGQHDLMHEMDDLKRGGASITACRRRRAKPSDAKKGSQGWASPQSLFQQCMRVDRAFTQLFNANVWNTLAERTQHQLHELYGEYQNARVQVDQLPEGKTEPQSGLGLIADSLSRIEGSIEEVTAKCRGAVANATNDEGAFTGGSPFSEFSSKRKSDLPWQVTRVALLTMAFQWLFMIAATAAEATMGPESLLKPPGEPPWIRDVKTRHWKPAMVHLSSNNTVPSDYALFDPPVARPPLLKSPEGHGSEGTHDADGHGSAAPASHAQDGHGSSADHATPPSHGGHSASEQDHHRRLAGAYGRRPEAAVSELLKALPALGRLADLLEEGATAPNLVEQEMAPALPSAFMAKEAKAKSVRWPALFEPRHLVCGPAGGSAVALTPHGFGALVPTSEGGIEMVEAQPFALEGLGELGPLVGAGWAEKGLELVTEAGDLLHCPGHQPGEFGAWRCGSPGGAARLPVPEGSKLLAAAVRMMPEGVGRFAAMLLDHLPGSVTLVSEGEDGWSPMGEVHLPPGSTAAGFRLGLSFAGEELLITTPAGEVHRRHFQHGPAPSHPAPSSGAGRREFRAACGMPTGVARLALSPQPRSNGGIAWLPELLMPEA
uniref:Uncharacterized protein n=1 Tax=Alexandrium catenella TaxID=2925 RepID=A0A7S1QK45_ALECA